MLQFAAEYLGWIVAIVGASGTLLFTLRRGGKRLRATSAKVNQVTDVLLGRDAILHPETGEELVAATPGIGTRMASMEQWQSEAGGILRELADTQSKIVHTNLRVDRLEGEFRSHVETVCPPPSLVQHVTISGVEKQPE